MRRTHALLLTTVALCWAAGAAATPQGDKCEAAKLRAAGKKALCRLKEDAKAVLGKTADLAKCSTKLSEKFTAAETAGGPECPTTGDAAGIEARVDAATDGIAQALAGARFVDNGDGTVTDTQTGLMWEKKDDGGGLHDKDNLYTWADAMSAFVSDVNGRTDTTNPQAPGLGGHNDWRLPSIDELQTILLAPFPCGTSPCIDPVFGPTVASSYWSATTLASVPAYAWVVGFGDGDVNVDLKTLTSYARAVRGGL
jgi:hypothetical protein